jgi:hypothetical protein
VDTRSLIGCWEQGRHCHAIDRALLLHALAEPRAGRDSLADRSLGERNAALLRLRQACFGDELRSCIDCSDCGERLEFALSAATLLTRPAAVPTHVSVAGARIRLPTSRDLMSIAGEPDAQSAERRLVERLTEPGKEGSPQPEVVARALEEADPCLDFTLDLACPGCGHVWSASLDVAAFLWEEVDARARRLLDEVHVLARAYGWTEEQILALSDARRNAYIDRVLA